MSLSESPRPALDSALEKQRVELADLIGRHTPQDGSYETRIQAFFLSRYSQPSGFSPSLPKPALCVMAQGNKEVRLGDEYFAYDPLNYLVVSVSMPISGRVLEVSPHKPILALRLDIEPAEITTLLSDAGPMGVPSRPAGCGLYVEPLDPPMLDALLR